MRPDTRLPEQDLTDSRQTPMPRRLLRAELEAVTPPIEVSYEEGWLCKPPAANVPDNTMEFSGYL